MDVELRLKRGCEVVMSARRVIMLALGLTSLSCSNTLLMDTARALPAGEVKLAGGLSAGYQNRGLISVSQSPEPDLRQLDINGNEAEVSWPWGLPSEYFIRGVVGLGAGLQLDLNLVAPSPAYGIGGAVGLKWALPLRSWISIAGLARASAQEVGSGSDGGRRYVVKEGDVGLILSAYDPQWPLEPYLASRLRVSALSLTQEGWRDASASMTSYVGSLGVKTSFGMYIETAAQYASQPEVVRVTFGVGFEVPWSELTSDELTSGE